MKRLSMLPKVTQQGSGKNRIQTHAIVLHCSHLRSLFFCFCFFLATSHDFTFPDPRILLMPNAALLIFLLSSHSCLKSGAEGVLTAFR